MCHFITATLPAEADVERVRQIAKSHCLAWVPADNPKVAAQLRAGELYFMTTHGHCQCGTPLGELRRHEKPEEPGYTRQLSKLRQKGWGKAKIERWLEQKHRNKEKRQRVVEHVKADRAAQVDRWISFFSTVIEVGASSNVGLLLHFYRSGPKTEDVKIARRDRKSVDTLLADDLLAMEEDVLYEFTR